MRIGDGASVQVLSWGVAPSKVADNNNSIYIPYLSAAGSGPNQGFLTSTYCDVVSAANINSFAAILPSATWVQIKVAEFARSPSFVCPTK
jgi:hypothetical protein